MSETMPPTMNAPRAIHCRMEACNRTPKRHLSRAERVSKRSGQRRNGWSTGIWVVAGWVSFGLSAYATNYSSLTIPQGGTVQMGTPSENLFLAMQSDGNLVLYQNGTALWNTSTGGQNCGANQCYAYFQGDGNFVVYNGSTPLWNSVTWGKSVGAVGAIEHSAICAGDRAADGLASGERIHLLEREGGGD